MGKSNFGAYEIDDDPARLDFDVIAGYLSGAYWASHLSRGEIETACARSRCIAAYAQDGGQVGFARAVSDGVTFALLKDVFVIDAHGGKGIARAMVQALIDHPDHAGVRLWTLNTTNAHGVYEALGFRHFVEEKKHMRMLRHVG